MNILFNKHFFVGFMVSEIPRVSVFGYFPLYIGALDNICYGGGAIYLYFILYILLFINIITN